MNAIKSIPIFLILFVFFSCKENSTPQKKEKKDTIQVVKKNVLIEDTENDIKKTEEECYSSFEEFIEVFGRDSLFQKKRIKFPLIRKYTYLNDNDRDTTEIETTTFQKYRFIDFSENKNAWKKSINAFRIEIEKIKDSVYYKLRGIDNGIYENRIFIKENNCWYLISVDNYST